ncbi:uncharacterized protein NECHADRAFT_70711 [Fusarium vanettenii 77-13-4]|uniref:Condensation domain-containing protein n=1 Tax=Fusarium vanettenii (strain ATCC MYA-4622 / CBS 123669 / FGSC 9596 / NRRL 45880 / 77-13-4) TaxID=660122 RepID=C7YX63_FUSV7|nr:uncharacterized protein NECHADRAFT_70711 [Fusarium vanettenii 77-13-4]EEU43776.1 hypothetical protein NECHADRAFT_70711 [Fusarium vanettenii 77-13-4]
MASNIPLSRHQWQISPKGTWARDVDECERFYITSSRKGNGCFPVSGCASFNVTPVDSMPTIDEEDWVEAALKKAWITLRYQHPTLGSRIERDENSDQLGRIYQSFDTDDEQDRWVGSTFKVVDTDVEPLEWFNNNTAAAFETGTLFLVRSNGQDSYRQTILLRCPHDVSDGVGVLQLVNQLFDYAAMAFEQGDEYCLPKWGKEYENLSPCIRIAAEMPESLSEAQTKRLEEIQTQNGTIYKHQGLLALPSSSTHAEGARDGKLIRLSHAVPKDRTSKILRGCKDVASGVSVTHVFMTALVMALSEVQPQKEDSYPVRYVNHSMINLRPYCQEPYNTPAHAAAAYHTISTQALGIDLVVPGSSDETTGNHATEMRKILPQVQHFFNDIRPVPSEEIHEQVAFAPSTFKSFTSPSGVDPHAVSEPPFCPVALSSIGNVSSMVQQRHGPFELTNVWAASEPMGAGVALFLGSWDDQLELSGVFDTRYHESSYVESFLERILNCVQEGLGVDGNSLADEARPVESSRDKKRKRV